jgi:hypothetical protein
MWVGLKKGQNLEWGVRRLAVVVVGGKGKGKGKGDGERDGNRKPRQRERRDPGTQEQSPVSNSLCGKNGQACPLRKNTPLRIILIMVSSTRIHPPNL